jgi:hypothetical protein
MTIDPTDVDALPVPAALQADPLEGTREQRIHLQGGEVAAEWWKTTLETHHLPGGPLLTRQVQIASGQLRPVLYRGDVFTLAHDPDDDEAVLRLLWHVLAWGSGMKLRHNRRRLASIASHRESRGGGASGRGASGPVRPRSCLPTVPAGPAQHGEAPGAGVLLEVPVLHWCQ